MQNRRENYKYEKQKYSAVFNTILGNYKKLYKNLHVDEVNTEDEFLQNGSDYQFIKAELCSKAKKEFYVVGGEVYFQTPDTSTDAFLTLEWGKNLISFQRGRGYCYKELKVSGGEDKTGNEVSEVVKTEADTPVLTTDTPKEEWTVESDMDTDIMQNCLDKKVQEKKQKNDTGMGNTIGLPEVVPGRYIEIKGVDSEDVGVYYITSVVHNFGSDGFTTSFSLGNSPTILAKGDDTLERKKSGKCAGVIRAVVKENWDEEHPGKVKVEFLTGEEGKKSTKWLPVAQPYCGNGYGFYFHPEIDTEVVVGSQLGDMNSLIVLGALWNKVDEPPADAVQEDNFIKKIRTKGKHEIVFDDNEDSAGIQIYTGNGLYIKLNDKDKYIS
ncbi:MAG: phage baseplate assembly protein V, partial [Lachnospiraceae bacterium]|nr:phage baseplate assembly protein V [Lachnospiraceae bacterium]